MPYIVKHLHTGQEFERPDIILDWSREEHDWTQHTDPAVEAFHKTLPHYGETELHNLPSIASELGVSHVFIKDESTRFGLPSFKILGASWAVHRTVCRRLGVPSTTSMAELASILKERNDVRLVSCTEGNWGRACARMAQYLGIPITIYVPGFMNDYTQDLLRGEGADVKVLNGGSYDDSIAAARNDAEASRSLLVMDTSWDGYTEIPEVSRNPSSSQSSADFPSSG